MSNRSARRAERKAAKRQDRFTRNVLVPFCQRNGLALPEESDLEFAEALLDAERKQAQAKHHALRSESRKLSIAGADWSKCSMFGRRSSAKESISFNREYRGVGVKFDRSVIDPFYGMVCHPKTGEIIQSWDCSDPEKVVDLLAPIGKPTKEESASFRKARNQTAVNILEYRKDHLSEIRARLKAEGVEAETPDAQYKQEVQCAIRMVREAKQARTHHALETLSRTFIGPQFNAESLGQLPLYSGQYDTTICTRKPVPVERRLPITRTTAGPLKDRRVEESMPVQRFSSGGALRDAEGRLERLTPPYRPPPDPDDLVRPAQVLPEAPAKAPDPGFGWKRL